MNTHCIDRQTVQGLRIHRNTSPRVYEQDRCDQLFHTSTPMFAYCELPGCVLDGQLAALGIERFVELANRHGRVVDSIRLGSANDRCAS